MYIMFINVSVSITLKNSFIWVKCPFKNWQNYDDEFVAPFWPTLYIPRYRISSIQGTEWLSEVVTRAQLTLNLGPLRTQWDFFTVMRISNHCNSRSQLLNNLCISLIEGAIKSMSSASGGSRIFARGVRQLVPLECPKPLHALSPSDR